MTTNEEHVRWLRRYAGNLKIKAEGLTKLGEGEGLIQARLHLKKATRLFEAADAFEMAAMQLTPEAIAEMGSRRVAKLLSPGARVLMHLVSERKCEVEIVTVGRYDVVARAVGESADRRRIYGRTLIIPKHAVLFYEMAEEVGDAAAT